MSRYTPYSLALAAACMMPAFTVALTPLASMAGSPQTEIDTQVPAARNILDGWQAQSPEKAERALHLVYWTPSDREPAPRYRERLSKILKDIRGFYAREMERNGFGPRTIRLMHDDDGLCLIHLVRGVNPYAEYGGESGAAIRHECLMTLRKAGLDPDRETLVIFCNMSNWDEAKKTMSQNSPYYAGGTNRGGTAWQVDSPLLDLDLLDDHEPKLQDGQYGHISVGRYNSIFIGGIAHELGHALGLPHNRARPDQSALWGTALMGSGNRTYGENLRGEGKGTFLTLGEALRLASHPIFCGSVKGFETKSNARLEDVKIEPAGKSIRVSARVAAEPPVYAVVGYTDPAGGGDYDATTYTAIPDKDGRFTMECDALKAGKAGGLRFVIAQANGAMTSFASGGGEHHYPYFVRADGAVDFSASQAKIALGPFVAAINGRQADKAADQLRALEAGKLDAQVLEVAHVLAATLEGKTGASPAEATGERCVLSEAATKEVSVGYGKPTANRLPQDDALLMSGSRLYARGLYAHAPARHAWELGGKWSRVTGTVGMAEGFDGSVEFSVLADGREIWKSGKIRNGDVATFDASVKEAKLLEFKVSDAGDGKREDWGLWLEPTLIR